MINNTYPSENDDSRKNTCIEPKKLFSFLKINFRKNHKASSAIYMTEFLMGSGGGGGGGGCMKRKESGKMFPFCPRNGHELAILSTLACCRRATPVYYGLRTTDKPKDITLHTNYVSHIGQYVNKYFQVKNWKVNKTKRKV